MSKSLNIILFGEPGVGKSSVVNLITGGPIAWSSPDVLGSTTSTMSFQHFSFPVSDRTLHIWDTVGLGLPETGVNGRLPAIEPARQLVRQLASQGGVDLLLFCIWGNRINVTTQRNYRLFYEVLCKSQVPIATVITHLEHEIDMDGWWARNEGSLENYGMKFAGHACVTGLPNHSKSRESRANIIRLLDGHNANRGFTMPPAEWFTEFECLFGLYSTLEHQVRRRDFMKMLTERCQLASAAAAELADRSGWVVDPKPPSSSRLRRIINMFTK